MPPITSPRRSAAFHGGPAPLGRPVSVPIPGPGMMASPTSVSAGSSPMSLGRQLNGTAPGHTSSYHHGNHPHNSGHSAHAQPSTHGHGASAASAAASHHSHHAPGTNMHTSPTSSAHINGNAHTGSLSHGMHPAPYMVALAGWPEPVFVSESRDTWEKKRSRPTTPTGHRPSSLSSSLPPLSGMEFRDGVGGDHHIVPGPALHSSYAHAHGVGMTRTASGNVPIDPALRSRPTSPTAAAHGTQQMGGFPTSSARDTDDGSTASGPSASASAVTSNASTPSVGPTPSGAPPPFLSLAPVTASAASMAISSPPATASTSASSAASSVHGSSHSHGPHHHAHGNPAAAAAAAQHAQHVLAARNVRRHVGGFADPRYANNASILGVRGRSLRVAPAWTTAGGARRGPPPPGASPASTQAASPGQPAAPVASSSGQAPGRRASPPTTSASAGVIHAAGARFRDPRVGLISVPHAHRAVPEVWPPPAPHVVSEVYPRDPDSPWMWASSASPSVVSVGNSTNPSNANSPYGGSPKRGQSPKAPPTIKEETVEYHHATTNSTHHKDAEDMDISAAPTPRDLKEEYHEPPPRERERERERDSYRDHVSQRPIAREHPYSNTRGSSVGESEEGMDVDPQL